MQRRTTTTSSTSSPSSRRRASEEENGGHQKSKRAANNGGNSRVHHTTNSSSFIFIPKSLIGTLCIISVGIILILISRLSSSSSSLRREASDATASVEKDVIRRIRAGKSNNDNILDQPSSVSTNTAKIINGDDVGLVSHASNATLHIIFSTDCGTFQHWQSYLFFHAALKVKQPGYITRIASGCKDDELKFEQEWHTTHIQSKLSDRFRIHFTPHFSGVKDEVTGEVKGDYKFFNKPFGLKHFLETNALLGVDEQTKSTKHPNDIIILTDPDFLLLRPITDDFRDERETLVGNRRQEIYKKKESHIVTHGNPYAQTYGLGTQWRKFDLDEIAGSDSPAKSVSQPDGGKLYPAGPPYIATAQDMYQIAITWSDFAPRVHKQYPHLLAEMYAYCIAAAHLRLPHMLIDSLMVSAAGIGGEGWKFIKEIPASEICSFGGRPNHIAHPVPSVIHYCQRYAVDKYFWSKRKIPHEIFTCEHPLMVEPPLDLGSGKYLNVVPNGKPDSQKKEITAEKEKMDAFMVCALTKATNDAMITFKKNAACNDGGNIAAKSYDVWAGKVVTAK